jgi:hypothetical protein
MHAEGPQGASEQSVRLLHQQTIVLPKLLTQRDQDRRSVDPRQQPLELLQARSGGHVRCEPIRHKVPPTSSSTALSIGRI